MKMKIVPTPPPNSRLIFLADRAPIARGYGVARFECGACGDVLLANFRSSDLRAAVFRCPSCGAYTEPTADELPPPVEAPQLTV